MNDLISKTAVIEILSTMQGRCDTKAALVQNSKIWQQVKDMPTVDAVPVRHGEFIGTEYDGYADGNPVYCEWVCSECGCVFEDEEPKYRYCPNCGARMGRKEIRMKEWICREMSTSTSGNENGVLMMETELIRCKDCRYFADCICEWHTGKNKWIVDDDDYCSCAERKDDETDSKADD